MTSDSKAAYLKDEYLLLQKFYEDYDARIITIKGWSATVGMAAIGAGFYQSRYLWLFAAGAAMVFWVVEALWKSFQYLYGPRIALIEQAFREDSFDGVAPFQVYSSWSAGLRHDGLHLTRNMLLGIVVFPHAVTLVAGLALFAGEALGIFSLPRR